MRAIFKGNLILISHALHFLTENLTQPVLLTFTLLFRQNIILKLLACLLEYKQMDESQIFSLFSPFADANCVITGKSIIIPESICPLMFIEHLL